MSELLLLLVANLNDRRNMLRVHRRYLRDNMDPFTIPEARFVELFRLKREAALDLLAEISPFMKIGERTTVIPKCIRLCVALHFYATGSYLRDVGQDFVCPVSKTMVCRIIHEVTTIIQNKLMEKYIKFPVSVEEQNNIRLRLFSETGFPGAVGAIDCIHVKIKKPKERQEHIYRNRKGYFSKNVQLICDYDLRILGCNARYGGGAHDAFIWQNSQASTFLESQYRQGINQSWLIGDSGYPLQPWLMTPFRAVESPTHENYNKRHASARNCVERLNGVLKKVFGCLSHDRGLLVDPAFAGMIINACCTLHNFRKKYNMPNPTLDGSELSPMTEEDSTNEEVSSNLLREGRAVRESIVRNYCR